jgi:cytochrome c-type biogenesis protein CcmH/NrfF
MRSKRTFIIVIALACVAPGAAGSGRKANLKSVANQVNCMCGGCVALLNQCPHPPAECSARAEMETLIEKDIAAGKDETAIVQDLVLRYGVKVLATPPAKGFNLMVWILPTVGVVAGLVLLIAITRRWRKVPGELHRASPAPVDPKVLAAVEAEMKTSGRGERN